MTMSEEQKRAWHERVNAMYAPRRRDQSDAIESGGAEAKTFGVADVLARQAQLRAKGKRKKADENTWTDEPGSNAVYKVGAVVWSKPIGRCGLFKGVVTTAGVSYVVRRDDGAEFHRSAAELRAGRKPAPAAWRRPPDEEALAATDARIAAIAADIARLNHRARRRIV